MKKDLFAEKTPLERNIYEVLQDIRSGQIILPPFQRNFVWNKQQIIRLFDSIMLGYPISTFIFWDIKGLNPSQNTYFYKCLEEVIFNSKGEAKEKDSGVPIQTDNVENKLESVLDGQQRLTSLYVTLLGQVKTVAKSKWNVSATPIELYLNLTASFEDEGLEGDERDYEDEDSAYKSRWLWANENPDKKKWFKVKDAGNKKWKGRIGREQEIARVLSDIGQKDQINAKENLELLAKRIFDDKIVNGLILNDTCGFDDAIEIFTRFNSGGTKLTNSELVFSTIEARWPEAKNEVEKFLETLNHNGDYKFDKIFFARLILVLFDEDKNGKNIQKTHITNTIVNNLKKKENWKNVISATLEARKFLKNECGITDGRTISSYISIIPIIYSIYKNGCQVKHPKDIKKYIYRSFMLNIFSRKTNTLLIELRKSIDNCGGCITMSDIENNIREFKVDVNMIESQIIEHEKSLTTRLILHLTGNDNCYFNIDKSEYHQDHIYPSAGFNDTACKPSGVSPEEWGEWRKLKNKLPNLQLLKGNRNISKSAKTLGEWFGKDGAPTEEKFRQYLDLPERRISLDGFEDFKEFYEHRKKWLIKKLSGMLL
jgi:uncharacterized protein with ParB-like and HNH nuclease domain